MITYSNWQTVPQTDKLWNDSDVEIMIFSDDVARKRATNKGVEVGSLLFSGSSYWVLHNDNLYGGFPTEDYAKAHLDRLVSYSSA